MIIMDPWTNLPFALGKVVIKESLKELSRKLKGI